MKNLPDAEYNFLARDIKNMLRRFEVNTILKALNQTQTDIRSGKGLFPTRINPVLLNCFDAGFHHVEIGMYIKDLITAKRGKQNEDLKELDKCLYAWAEGDNL